MFDSSEPSISGQTHDPSDETIAVSGGAVEAKHVKDGKIGEPHTDRTEIVENGVPDTVEQECHQGGKQIVCSCMIHSKNTETRVRKSFACDAMLGFHCVRHDDDDVCIYTYTQK